MLFVTTYFRSKKNYALVEIVSGCINECTSNEDLKRIAACAYTCEMTFGYENPEFSEVIQCLIAHDCLVQYPDDGLCYGNDLDSIQYLTNMNQVWIISHEYVYLKTLNPGPS